MKLLVAVPSARDWKIGFALSMMDLQARLGAIGVLGRKLDGLDFHILSNASLLPRARQMAITAAISDGHTHLLMLDDDIVFPRDAVDRLAQHGLPVVGGNYISKGLGGTPTATSLKGDKALNSTGIDEVAWMGLGCVLIDVDVLRNIPEPHFEVRWVENPDTGFKGYLGEDCYFFNKLRQHGIKIHVDHDLKLGHIGDYDYRLGPRAAE